MLRFAAAALACNAVCLGFATGLTKAPSSKGAPRSTPKPTSVNIRMAGRANPHAFAAGRRDDGEERRGLLGLGARAKAVFTAAAAASNRSGEKEAVSSQVSVIVGCWSGCVSTVVDGPVVDFILLSAYFLGKRVIHVQRLILGTHESTLTQKSSAGGRLVGGVIASS